MKTGEGSGLMSAINVNVKTRQATFDRVEIRSARFSHLVFLGALTAIGVILLGLILSILRLNNGTFLYTMDDPYIDLALSDQIRHGNYGMNPGEPAAPSSSILYPLLEVPASGTPLHPYLPLILNSLAMFATIAIMHRFFVYLRLAQDGFGVVVEGIALVLFAVCFNLIAVVFTGFEHSLHIAATAACIYGLAVFLDTENMPAWLPAVIIVAPLLRYEGLALSVGAILVLALRKRWWIASGTLVLIVLTVGGFSAFLVSLKLPPLPSSVLVKSQVVVTGMSGTKMGVIGSMLRNARSMSKDPVGLLLLLIGIAAAIVCISEFPAKPWHWTPRGLMSLVLVAMVGGHAAAGSFGWFNRYEDYLIVGTALICIYLKQETIRSALLNRKRRLLWVSAGAVALLLITSRYVTGYFSVPGNTHQLYEQNFQMHRFVNDFYRGPVAVYDIGLIAYHNPNYFLDLGGLSSEKARSILSDAVLSDVNSSDMDPYGPLVSSSGVKVVILTEGPADPDPTVPVSWKKVALLPISRQQMVLDPRVLFYTTDTPSAKELQPELQAFSKSLPAGMKLTIYDSLP